MTAAAPCPSCRIQCRGANAANIMEFPLDTELLTQRISELAVDRKALDVVTLDIREHSSYADFLVICSGTSDRHVQSIAEVIEGTLSKEGIRSMGREGLREGQWALIDFGNVVLHVFHQFTRADFDIESLWKTAPKRLAKGSERSENTTVEQHDFS